MELYEIHTPLFDLSITKTSQQENHYCLKYKDRILEDFVSSTNDFDPEVNLTDDPETFLDFDAVHYPDYINFTFDFEPDRIHNNYRLLSVFKKDGAIFLEYIVDFSKDETLDMKLNPFRILKNVLARVEARGMKANKQITGTETELYGFVSMQVLSGNLAEHYLRGVAILENLFDEVINEIENP